MSDCQKNASGKRQNANSAEETTICPRCFCLLRPGFCPPLSFRPVVALLYILEFLNMPAWMILYGCPALVIAGIVLLIIAIVKRESRGEGLAIAAFFFSSFPLVHIAYFSFVLLYGLLFSGRELNPLFFWFLVFLPFVTLPLGIIAISLAIAAIVAIPQEQYVSIWDRAENNLPNTSRERRLRYRKLAVFAIVVGILEIVLATLSTVQFIVGCYHHH